VWGRDRLARILALTVFMSWLRPALILALTVFYTCGTAYLLVSAKVGHFETAWGIVILTVVLAVTVFLVVAS